MSGAGQHVLILIPGQGTDAPTASLLMAAAARAGVAAERLLPASENALRARLETGEVGLVFLLASLHSRAAASYNTVELDAAAGTGTRSVNLRHLGRLLSRAPAPCVVVLQPADGAADTSAAPGVLAAHGAGAAIAWPAMAPTSALEHAAHTLFTRFRAGATLAELAGAADGAHFAGAREAPARVASTTPLPPPVPPATQDPPAPGAPDARDPGREAREAAALLEAKRASGSFDVFLCHNGADKPEVRDIARSLRTRGVLPWLDEWELPPGQPWQPLLEAQMTSIRSAAVFVGAAGVGPWQQQELYGFLREFVSRRAPVIPVLLADAPAAPELPIFLRAMTWVDFRQAEPDPMTRLVWGITGERPAWG